MNKCFDAYSSPSLVILLDTLNKEKIKKEEIVQILLNKEDEYLAIIYK